jgi:hypothetical protein
MTVLRDFRLEPEEASLALVGGGSADRPGVRRKLELAREDLLRLAEPAACYEVVAIEALMHDRLQLAGGVRIGSDAVARVVAGAEDLYVALCTLGGALDERIREHHERGRYLEMLLLDELGSWAVDSVRQQLYRRIEAELVPLGRRVSSPLSPGESSWSIREQRKIFKLVDAAALGVSLDQRNLMAPRKSLSLVFGAGTEEMGVEGLLLCELCSIRERCRYSAARMARAAQA